MLGEAVARASGPGHLGAAMANPAPPPSIFDPARVRRARARAARRFHDHDFLHRRAMADIVDRLETVNRGFETALFHGVGALCELLTPACGVGRIVHADSAPARLGGCSPALACDEEAQPWAPARFDLVVSLLTLHRANDLVGALGQYRAALKPDGLLIAALFGEDTLAAFKQALIAAESDATGGAASRIPPFATVKDLGAGLQRAGFALPVADIDRTDVQYTNPMRLLEDLRGMGEAGGLRSAGRFLRRDVVAGALARFGASGGAARFDIVYLTGWAPHPDQPKPLTPGSAQRSLADAIKGAK